MDEDISRLKATALSLLTDLGCNGSVLPDDLINEMCRFGASELHVVSAFIGGIASQEVIKVRFIYPSYFFYVESLMGKWLAFRQAYRDDSILSCLSVYLFAACHEAVCSDVWDLHLQWHWSQVSVIEIVEDLSLHIGLRKRERELFIIPIYSYLSRKIVFWGYRKTNCSRKYYADTIRLRNFHILLCFVLQHFEWSY